jgi:tetratricopeptide (TPR) repeat protein
MRTFATVALDTVLGIGLKMSIALGASWLALGQNQVPPPPVPPSAPIVAPVPPAMPVEAGELAPPMPPIVELIAPEGPVSTPFPPRLLEDLTISANAAMVTEQAMALAALQAQTVRPRSSDQDDHYYERGQSNLDANRWDKAVDDFGEVVSRGGARADGALYWKAYALNKLGRRDEALAAIAELRKNYAASRWLDDARALEIEIKQAAGKPVSPESADDEEMKLMALNSILNSDPERALPLVEKLLHSSQSPKIKERAMFVLTQNGSPKARQLVVQIAKGNGNPDLQMKAVHYLGIMGAKQELGEVYAATNDVEVKQAVLHGLMVAGAKEQLLAAAKGEKSTELRQQAIHWLGTMGAEPELWQLYQAEQSLEVKQALAHALFIGGKTDRLLEIARTAREPELREQAIHWLGASGSHQAGDALAAMYVGESNTEVKKQIIHALFIQNNGKALVEIARKETNMELKKEIVHSLSVMKSKEGTDYLMELLNK